MSKPSQPRAAAKPPSAPAVVSNRARKPAGSGRHHHSVYVIELDDRVLNHRKFREANQGYDVTKPCLYVGCTGLSVEQRFANHKRGYKGNTYVRDHGLRLRPDMYAFFNPMPYRAALTMEIELAQELRDKGHAVWQA